MPSLLPLLALTLVLTLTNPSAANPFTCKAPLKRFIKKKFETVHGKRMAYVEIGKGDPIVFLHGNPTSSFLWRNVMPHLEGRGRLIAPDLIGMGDSDKLDNSGPNRYTFVEHSTFLFTLLEKLDVKERVTLVIHDWGSALGFLWAYQNRHNKNAVNGIAFLESLVVPFPSLEIFPEASRQFFQALRGPEGEKLVLEENLFLETVLKGAIENLTQGETGIYRKPFLNTGEDRRPMLTFARELPIAGEPANVAKVVTRYGEWLKKSKLKKLFINVEPGSLSPVMRPIVRTWNAVTEVSVQGMHYAQENSPDEIGQAIAEWL